MGRNMERVVGDTTLSDVQWGLFQKKVNCRKLNLAQVRRFVTSVLLEKLDVQDDLVVDFVQNMIEEAGRNDIVPKPLNALEVATNLTGFIGDDKSITFLEHLWPFLLHPTPNISEPKTDKIIPLVKPSLDSFPRDDNPRRHWNPKYTHARKGTKRRWEESGDRQKGKQNRGRKWQRQDSAVKNRAVMSKDAVMQVPIKLVASSAETHEKNQKEKARKPEERAIDYVSTNERSKEKQVKTKKNEKMEKKGKKQKKQKKEKKLKREKRRRKNIVRNPQRRTCEHRRCGQKVFYRV